MPDALASVRTADVGLVGRSAESSALASFLERALGTGAVLLVTGEPGVGKTVLLETVVRDAAASGATVLQAAGVQFEADVGFAGLNQLLLPLLDHLEALPELHRDALAVALGMGAGPPPHRLLVSAAVLGLLMRAAETRPVLLVLDDVPWLDRPSARVLGFVARRLDRRRIGVLAAARAGSDCVLLQTGLPQLEVPPLDDDAAAELLQTRFPVLGAETRQRVLSASQGNPLALLELPAVMTESQRTGSDALPSALPLSSHLQRVFAQQLADLPERTRSLMLLAALEGTGDLRTLRAVAATDGWLDDLAPAERARLLRIDLAAGRVTLRHPLIGSAAVELSTSGERRRAHRALAHVLVDRPEECAWHLAEAAVGADAHAADLLETAAHRARHKGDAVRAVNALLRAADLTPSGPDRPAPAPPPRLRRPTPRLVPATPSPSPTHGDLWASHVIDGRWFVDPEASYADRELGLAYMRAPRSLPVPLGWPTGKQGPSMSRAAKPATRAAAEPPAAPGASVWPGPMPPTPSGGPRPLRPVAPLRARHSCQTSLHARRLVRPRTPSEDPILGAVHRRLTDQDREPSHLMHSGSINSSDGFPEVESDAKGMGVGRSASYRARRRATERRRQEQPARRGTTDQSAGLDVAAPKSSAGGARRAAAVSCSWCDSPITPRSRGPIPKWCSANCRRCAWEQARAAASGRSAVHVVERWVEVRAPVTPTRGDWVALLGELARQLDDGRIYDRDLAALTAALRTVLAAHSRRPWVRDRRSGGSARLW